MKNAKLITLSSLPDIFYVDLDINFREYLFNSARKNRTWGELSKQLGYTRDRLFCLRRGYRNILVKKEKNMISMKLIRKLSEMTNIDIDEIEKHVDYVKSGCSGQLFQLKLPIYQSPELSSIIAHEMGDGHLRDRTFVYFNESKELIKNMKENIKRVFGNIEPKTYVYENGTRIVYPAIISRLIHLVGGVRFNKVEQEFDIPQWIKDGDEDIKIAFLKSIFDDESYINVGDKYITLQMATVKKYNKIINSIGKLLKELNMNSIIAHKGTYTDKNNVIRNMIGVTIGRFESINRYKQIIGYEHMEKQRKLADLIESYKYAKYIKYENINNNYKNQIKQSDM